MPTAHVQEEAITPVILAPIEDTPNLSGTPNQSPFLSPPLTRPPVSSKETEMRVQKTKNRSGSGHQQTQLVGGSVPLHPEILTGGAGAKANWWETF